MNDLRVENVTIGVAADTPTLVSVFADQYYVALAPDLARRIAGELLKAADAAEQASKELN